MLCERLLLNMSLSTPTARDSSLLDYETPPYKKGLPMYSTLWSPRGNLSSAYHYEMVCFPDCLICLKGGYPVELQVAAGDLKVPVEYLNIPKDCVP